jgi:hypothetical protein
MRGSFRTTKNRLRMKIAKVITECLECEFCTKGSVQNSNKTNFLVCMFPMAQLFLIDANVNESVMNFEHKIPENCPLEDYKTQEP